MSQHQIMTSQERSCNQCGKVLSSYKSLWRHRKTCKGSCKQGIQSKCTNCLPISEEIRYVESKQPLIKTDEQTYPRIQTLCQKTRDRVDQIATLNPSSQDESSMDINHNSELESDGSSVDDKDKISTYSLNSLSKYESSLETTHGSKVDDKDEISHYALSEPAIRKHSIWLPPNTRAIIVGKSGCGKTTLLSHLLMCPDVMEYDNLVVCGRSLHQPEYRIMQRGFDMGLSNTQIGCLFRMKDKMRERCGSIDQFLDEYSGICKGNADAVFIDDVTAIPDPCENDTRKKNLLVLDDVMLSPQNKVEAYFTRGRHNNVDVIYITQSYFRLPRQTIRENGNMFIFFKQVQKNLTHIFNDHCAGDGIPFQEFCNWCNDVWQKGKYNFVTIDLTRPVEFGKYRKNLKDFWLNSNFRK